MAMNESNGFFNGDWLGAFLIIAVMFGGNGLFGNGGSRAATQAEVQAAINAQSNQATLENIMLSSANNNLENFKATSDQTMFLSNQNNTNLINAIQGFNTVNTGMVAGFNQVNQNIANSSAGLQQAIADLGYKMDQCCCSIKTMMLENRLADTQSELNNSRNVNNLAAQSQYILSQLGSFKLNTGTTA